MRSPFPCSVAASYAPCASKLLTNAPKREHDTPAWRPEIAMLVVEHGGDTVLPRSAITRALYQAPLQSLVRMGRRAIMVAHTIKDIYHCSIPLKSSGPTADIRALPVSDHPR